jgi:hypothetical protein
VSHRRDLRALVHATVARSTTRETEIESASQESMNEKPKSSFHDFLINFSSA